METTRNELQKKKGKIFHKLQKKKNYFEKNTFPPSVVQYVK